MLTANEEIADVLERVAALLEAQEANPYRVNAYRKAARLVGQSNRSVAELALSEEGEKLEDLPDIGKSIAGAIREFVHTGRLSLLERLEGQVSPEDLFSTVPGIGEELAGRIHSYLHIDTLEELELAAHDGRLQEVPGLGDRRVRAIRDSVGAILSRSSRRRARRLRHLEKDHEEKPPVSFIRSGNVENDKPPPFQPGWEIMASYSSHGKGGVVFHGPFLEHGTRSRLGKDP
jgi:DNA polymerase (family 10)